MTTDPMFAYTIDRDDRIQSKNVGWDQFAKANGAEEMLEVEGQLLWDFIDNTQVDRIYRTLLGLVRQTGRPIRFAFRCDCAASMRFMEMRIEPADDGVVHFKNHLVAEQPRGTPLKQEVMREIGTRALPMCSKCNKIRVLPGWVEIDEALSLRLVEEPLRVRYGLCDACNADLQVEIDRLRALVQTPTTRRRREPPEATGPA